MELWGCSRGRGRESAVRQDRKQAKEQDTLRTRDPATGKQQLRKQESESEKQDVLTLVEKELQVNTGIPGREGPQGDRVQRW